MLKLSSVIVGFLLTCTVNAQTWQWSELAPMPMATTNNAVCEALVNGSEYVYSFGGLDTSKVFSGIHNRSFKYSVSSNSWSELDTLPENSPVIAAAASFVKNKIYILGGYHVAQNGNETSSNRVHVFNPLTDVFETDGASIPFPIDDHVQCVYHDSLIFVVSGWSNTGNVPYVQIYNPLLNQWQAGTNTPGNSFFTAFGASGYILGDTLYYFGGASGASFGARKYMRKGFINPADPTDIQWSQMVDAPGNEGYRSACSGTGNTVFWIGGSSVSYNYNGIAYNGSGGVNPSARILHFNNSVYQYSDETSEPFGVMDLRGIAKLGNNRWIVCGGMDSSQVVTKHTFLLESNSVGIDYRNLDGLKVRDLGVSICIESVINESAVLFDLSGKCVRRFQMASEFIIRKELFPSGVYYFIQKGRSIRIRI